MTTSCAITDFGGRIRRSVAAAVTVIGMMSWGWGFASDWPMAGADPQHTMRSHAPVPHNPHIVWQTQLEGAVYAGPALVGDTVYIAGHDRQVWALSASSGKVRWKRQLGDVISTTPAVAGQTVVVGAKDGILSALDSRTGEIRWQLKTEKKIVSSPVIDRGVVYVGSNDLYLYAVKLDSGSLLWRHLTDGYKYSGIFCAPTLDSEKVYFGTKDGDFYALYRDNGGFVWRREVGSSVYRAALLAGEHLYVGSYDRRVYALDRSSGTVMWRTSILDDWPMGTPVQVDGMLYVPSRGGIVYGINLSSGKIEWQDDIGVSVMHGFIVGSNRIGVIGTVNGDLFAFDLRQQRRLWQKTLPNAIKAPLALSSHGLVAVTEGGLVTLLR